MTGNTDFDLFRTTEDHEALRGAVRAVAEAKIAPFAAEVDEQSRYPQEAHDALVAAAPGWTCQKPRALTSNSALPCADSTTSRTVGVVSPFG